MRAMRTCVLAFCLLGICCMARAEGVVRISLQSPGELDSENACSRYDPDSPAVVYALLVVDSLPGIGVKMLDVGFELVSRNNSIENLGFRWAPGCSRLDTGCEDFPGSESGRYARTPAVLGYWVLRCPQGSASSGHLRLTPNPNCRSDFIWAVTKTGLTRITRAYHAGINSEPPPPTEFGPRGDGPDSGERVDGGLCDNVMVNDPRPRPQGAPAIAVAPLQRAYIAWFEDTGHGANLWFSKSLDGGLNWTTDIRMAQGVTGGPSITLYPYRPDTIYVAADGYGPGSTSIDVLFWRSDSGGDAWPDSAVIVNDDPDHCSYVEIARGSNGDLYVVWIKMENPSWGCGEVLFSKSSDQGITWCDAITISDDDTTGTNWHLDPQIVVDPAGTIYVVWADGRRDNGIYCDIYFSRSTDGGLSWSPNARVNDDFGQTVFCRHPDICAPKPGVAYVCWCDSRVSVYDYQIYFSSSADSGNTWSDDIKVTDPGSYSCWGPDITALDLENRIYVTWCDRRNSPMDLNEDIFLSESIDNGLTWSPDIELNDDPGSEDVRQWDPKIALHCDFTAICWSDERRDTFDVYFCSCLAKASVSESAGQTTDLLCVAPGGPNPTPGTYSVRLDAFGGGIVAADVYDIRGRLLKKLYESPQGKCPTSIVWDGLDNSGGLVTPGAYFIVIKGDRQNIVNKVIVVR